MIRGEHHSAFLDVVCVISACIVAMYGQLFGEVGCLFGEA